MMFDARHSWPDAAAFLRLYVADAGKIHSPELPL